MVVPRKTPCALIFCFVSKMKRVEMGRLSFPNRRPSSWVSYQFGEETIAWASLSTQPHRCGRNSATICAFAGTAPLILKIDSGVVPRPCENLPTVNTCSSRVLGYQDLVVYTNFALVDAPLLLFTHLFSGTKTLTGVGPCCEKKDPANK